MQSTVRIGLMRHAQTDYNRDKRIQGQTDTDLTPQGEAMALGWGRSLACLARDEALFFDQILSSDLTRARRTAELVNQSLKLPLRQDARLREADWGHWSGRLIRELREREGDALSHQEARGWRFQPPGGEDRLQVLARAAEAILDAARRYPGKDLLVVTHQGVIKCLTYHLLGMAFLPEEGDPLTPYTLQLLSHSQDTLGPNGSGPDGLKLERLNVAFPEPEPGHTSVQSPE